MSDPERPETASSSGHLLHDDTKFALGRIAVFQYAAVAVFLFLIAGFAETRRIPFDLSEAESELVAGYHSEYSGMKFGMFFVGEYMGVTLISGMISVLFFGGWLGPVLPGLVWFLIKTFVFISFFILVRAALPRPRFDQLMSWGWKVILPLALANVLLAGAAVLLRS